MNQTMTRTTKVTQGCNKFSVSPQ